MQFTICSGENLEIFAWIRFRLNFTKTCRTSWLPFYEPIVDSIRPKRYLERAHIVIASYELIQIIRNIANYEWALLIRKSPVECTRVEKEKPLFRSLGIFQRRCGLNHKYRRNLPVDHNSRDLIKATTAAKTSIALHAFSLYLSWSNLWKKPCTSRGHIFLLTSNAHGIHVNKVLSWKVYFMLELEF